MSFWDVFAGPIGSIAGGFLNWAGQNSANQANRDIANQTNAMNRDIAREQMEFQERMSSTSFQRGVEDMRKAGINPLLAATQGGASSPSGAAVGAVTGAPMVNKFSRAQEAVASAIQARNVAAQLDQIKWSTRKTISDIDLNNALKVSALADASLKENNARVAKVNAENMKYQQAGIKVESDLDKTIFGSVTRAVNRFLPFAHSAAHVKHAFHR